MRDIKETMPPKDDKYGGELSLPFASFYVAKACIGVGILFLPACFARLGLLPAVVLSLACYLLCTLGVNWIASASLQEKCPDLVELSGSIHRHARIVVGALMVSMALSSLVVYLRLIVDSFIGIFRVGTRTSVTAITAAAILPIASVRSTRHISWISFAGLLGMLYVVLIVVVDYFAASPSTPPQWSLAKAPQMNWIGSLANIMYAFGSEFWIPQVAVLSPPRHLSSAVTVGMSATVATYLLMGIFGYLRFGDGLQEAVIHAYPAGCPLTFTIAQGCLSLVYLFSFPLILAPVRILLGSVYDNCRLPVHLLETAVLVALVTLTSLYASTATLIISDIVGALGNAPVALCLPPLLAYTHGVLDSWWSVAVGAAMFAAGVALWLAGMVSIVHGMIGR